MFLIHAVSANAYWVAAALLAAVFAGLCTFFPGRTFFVVFFAIADARWASASMLVAAFVGLCTFLSDHSLLFVSSAMVATVAAFRLLSAFCDLFLALTAVAATSVFAFNECQIMVSKGEAMILEEDEDAQVTRLVQCLHSYLSQT